MKQRYKKMLPFGFALWAFPLIAMAQELNVSGRVLDGRGDPVVGAAVVVKGTVNGVTTDINGYYNISAPADATLVFSFLGLGTKEEAVQGRSRVDAKLGKGKVAAETINVSGHVTDSKGNPVEDVRIAAYDSKKEFDKTNRIDESYTDESGFYSLKEVPKDGLLIVSVGYENRQHFVAVDGRKTIYVQLHSPDIEPITLSGKVRNSKDDIISGATIAASGINAETTTDDMGEFELEAFNGGTLIVVADGYKPQVVQVNGKRIAIQLEAVK